jgi:imidazolonepropionase-like amidohydrolase
VRAQVKAGADFIKVFATGGGSTPGTNLFAAQYSEAEMCALTEEARRLDKRVASHAARHTRRAHVYRRARHHHRALLVLPAKWDTV